MFPKDFFGVLWRLCLRLLCRAVTDQHFSIQEVDHQEQMFATSAWLKVREGRLAEMLEGEGGQLSV